MGDSSDTTDVAPADEPGPFSIEHDSTDSSHCAFRVETTLEELADTDGVTVDTGWFNMEPGELRKLLTERADEADDDEIVAAYNDACDQLRICDEFACGCADSDWDATSEWIGEHLDGLGDHLWLLTGGGGDGRGVINDPLDLDTIFALTPMSKNYGYSDVRVAWDGTRLEVTFSGYPWGSEHISAVRANDVQRVTHDEWTSVDNDDNDVIAARLTTATAAAMEFAGRAVEDGIDTGRWYFTELLDAGEVFAAAGTCDHELFLGLARDWDGTLVELAETCVALTADSHAIAA